MLKRRWSSSVGVAGGPDGAMNDNTEDESSLEEILRDEEAIEFGLRTLELPLLPSHLEFVYNRRGRGGPRTRHIHCLPGRLMAVAEAPVKLVPIRLDVELDGVKLRDQFTWNLNETVLTPEVFAQQLVDDFGVMQASLFKGEIAEQIRKQVAEYAMAVEDDPTGTGETRVVDEEGIEHEDIRIVIKLDLNVGAMYLKDQFEWPLFSTQTYLPEDFARSLAAELGMSGEFVPMIAHTIREQICLARLQFEDALQAPHLETRPLRYEPMTDAWGPEIKLLDEEELGRIAKEKERESRRMRRQRGTGPRYGAGQGGSNAVPAVPLPIHSLDTTASAPVSQPNYSVDNATFSPTYYNPQLYCPNFNQHSALFQQFSSPSGGPIGLANGAFNAYTASPQQMNGRNSPSPSPRGVTLQQHQQDSLQRSGGPPMKIAYKNYQATEEDMAMLENYVYKYTPPAEGHASKVSPQSKGARSNASPGSTTANRSPAKKADASPIVVDSALLFKQLEMLKNAPPVVEGPPLTAPPVPYLNSSPPQKQSTDVSPAKKHRGFGASAQRFNADDSIDVGEFRMKWRCSWCLLSGKYTPTLRKGPLGPKTVCNACGIWFGKNGTLPQNRFHEHQHSTS